MLRLITSVLLSFFILYSPFATASEAHLSSLVQRALQHNPEIRAVKEAFFASEQRAPQEGAWDDPRFLLRFKNVPVDNASFSRTPMSSKDIGITQKIPTSGRKWTSKKIAQFETESKRNEMEDIIARTVWLVKDRYYELAYVIRAIDITRKNKVAARGLVDMAKSRLSSEENSPEQEVFQAQLDNLQYSKVINYLTRRKTSLLAELSSIVADDNPIPLPNWGAISRQRVVSNKSEAVFQDLKNNPRILRRVSLMEAAEKRVQLAKQKWIPDVDVNFTYSQRDRVTGDPVIGENFFSAGVIIPLPVYGARKQGRHVIETKALLRESQARLEDAKKTITFELEDAWAEYKMARDDVGLIGGSLLPNARGALDTSIAAYKAGKTDFLNVLTGQMAVHRYEMDLARSKMDGSQAAARIDYLGSENVSETDLLR